MTDAEKLPIGHELEPLPLDDKMDTAERMERAIAVADLRFQFLQRVTTIALKRTLAQDWTDFSGTPYLSAAGCERIRPLFGITIDNVQRQKLEDTDKDGPYYIWLVDGIAHFHGDSLAVQGKCSGNHIAVPAQVLSAALYARFESRGRAELANKLLSAMRLGFGGHVEQQAP